MATQERTFVSKPAWLRLLAINCRAGEGRIIVIIIESNIHEGRKEIPANGIAGLRERVRITDGCIG